jgi:peptidyl-prolyl cis-trans isomerase C
MKFPVILAACATLAVIACAKKEAPTAPVDAAPASPPVVTVNGKAISQAALEAYAENLVRRPFEELTPEEREQVKENMVRVELFAQDAEKTGLAREPEVVAALEAARLQILQQATMKKVGEANKPTDTELRAEYDNLIATMPLVEYHARHIVVSGEDVAMKIIDRLKGGQDFASLARQLSTFKETSAGSRRTWWIRNSPTPWRCSRKARSPRGRCRRAWAGT